MAYKIQHLGLGGILDQAIAITRDHFGLLFTIMLLLLVPYTLITGFINLSLIPEMPLVPTAQDMAEMQEVQARYWPLFTLFGLINFLLVYPVTNAAVISAVAKLYLGRPVTAMDAIRHGFRRLLPLLGTTILMYLAIFGGMILLIIPGVLFALWFGLSQHVVVIEEIAGPAALGRSKKLVRPHLGTFLALGIILFVILLALQLGAYYAIPQRHVHVIVTALLTAVATVVGTAAGVVFYFSCRCAEENFDLHYLAEAIGAGPVEAVDGEPFAGR